MTRKTMDKESYSINIIIPSYNAGEYISDLIRAIKSQTRLPDKIIVVDSSSTDDSVRQWEESGVELVKIPKHEFNHGGTRNYAAQLTSAAKPQVLVFMTQDAIPANEHWLQNLVLPIESNKAAAVFARQLPRPSEGAMERFARYFNYPSVSQIRTLNDIKRLGVKAFFFSNVCSAVDASVFWKLGGFPENTIMNEDMIIAARLLKNGHSIMYEARSLVVHSHNYNIIQHFKRSFDIGVFFIESKDEMRGAAVGGEGVKFILGQAGYVYRHGQLNLLPKVLIEGAARFLAFQLGKQHRHLPLYLKKKLSMHSYHWDQPKEQG